MADLSKVYAALEDFAQSVREQVEQGNAPFTYIFGDRETDAPTMSDVYHALREVIIRVELYNQDGLVEAYNEGFAEGKEDGYDDGWDDGYAQGQYDA